MSIETVKDVRIGLTRINLL